MVPRAGSKKPSSRSSSQTSNRPEPSGDLAKAPDEPANDSTEEPEVKVEEEIESANRPLRASRTRKKPANINTKGSATSAGPKSATPTSSTRKGKIPTPAASSTRSAPKRKSSQPSTAKPKVPARRGKNSAPIQPLSEDEALPVDEEALDEAEDDGGTTRCVCGKTDDNGGDWMIQCEQCKAWQHGPCVGLLSEKAAPEMYYCEECKPELHPMGVPKSPPPPPRQRKSSSKADSPVHPPEPTPTITLPTPTEDETFPVPALPASRGDKQVRHDPPKRRSTMNSRDAAYEMNLAEALRLSKQMSGLEEGSVAKSEEGEQSLHPPLALPEHPEEMELDQKVEAIQSVLDPALEGEMGGISVPVSPEQQAAEAPIEQPVQEVVEEQNLLSVEQDQSGERERSRTPNSVPIEIEPPTQADAGTISAAPSPPAQDVEQEPEAEMDVDEIPEKAPIKRRAPNKRSRAAMEADDDSSHHSGPPYGKGKHPNQYTYRAQGSKPPPQPARGRYSPQKRAPIDRTRSLKELQDPTENLQWSIPEHLSHLSHLLGDPAPVPLSVPTFDSSKQHAFPAPSDSTSESGSSTESARTTRIEVPTKIRYPGRRMTMNEMRKRSKTMLDYLAKVQVEMSDRSARPGQSGSPSTPQSFVSMNDLSRDLVKFQESYLGQGKSGLNISSLPEE